MFFCSVFGAEIEQWSVGSVQFQPRSLKSLLCEFCNAEQLFILILGAPSSSLSFCSSNAYSSSSKGVRYGEGGKKKDKQTTNN